MGTSAIVRLVAPADTTAPDVVITVRYDGNEVGDELETIIQRDGYSTAHATFRDQPSRNWRELTPAVGSVLPDYVTDFPQNIAVSAPVEGYGVLFIGENTIAAETIGDGTGWARDVAYTVNAAGKVRSGL